MGRCQLVAVFNWLVVGGRYSDRWHFFVELEAVERYLGIEAGPHGLSRYSAGVRVRRL